MDIFLVFFSIFYKKKKMKQEKIENAQVMTFYKPSSFPVATLCHIYLYHSQNSGTKLLHRNLHKNRSSVTPPEITSAALTSSGFAIFLAGGTWVTIHGDVQCVAYHSALRASIENEREG